MDQVSNTSFIPKQSLTKTAPTAGGYRAPGMLSAVAFVILAVSLLFAVGTYAYKLMLENEINSPCNASGKCGLSESVEKEKRALDPERLNRYKRLDAKMKLAAQVIDKHNTLIPFFDVLSSSTLKSIRYTKLSFGDDYTLNLEGEGEGSYEDVAVQSKILSEIKQIKSFMFSDLNLDDRNRVTFKLLINLDPSLLSYRLYSDTVEIVNSLSPALMPADVAASLPVAPAPAATGSLATSTSKK